MAYIHTHEVDAIQITANGFTLVQSIKDGRGRVREQRFPIPINGYIVTRDGVLEVMSELEFTRKYSRKSEKPAARRSNVFLLTANPTVFDGDGDEEQGIDEP